MLQEIQLLSSRLKKSERIQEPGGVVMCLRSCARSPQALRLPGLPRTRPRRKHIHIFNQSLPYLQIMSPCFPYSGQAAPTPDAFSHLLYLVPQYTKLPVVA